MSTETMTLGQVLASNSHQIGNCAQHTTTVNQEQLSDTVSGTLANHDPVITNGSRDVMVRAAGMSLVAQRRSKNDSKRWWLSSAVL